MSREVRRVPLDFDWPLKEVWSGYLRPEALAEVTCAPCDGSGYSAFARLQQARWYGQAPFSPAETGSTPLTPGTPKVRALAERHVANSPNFYGGGEAAVVRVALRLCDLWNGMWSHHLRQADVDVLLEAGRLMDFTHRWTPGNGWQPMAPAPVVTADQVNTWSIGGIGHDAINCSIVVEAVCERAGQPSTCPDCEGHGSRERYAGQRAEAEAWEPDAPPTGEGWQLWETTTEGSPASPVFATGEELAQWMSQNACGFAGSRITLDVARKWVLETSGWSPSMVAGPAGLQDGITFVVGES